MTWTLDAANQLAADIRAALDAAGVAGVTVTTDPESAGALLDGGLVLIGPPAILAGPTAHVDLDWTVVVATRGTGLDAWRRLDTILRPLIQSVYVTTADPGSLTAGETKHAAYTLRLDRTSIEL